jgi:virulence-associated protein VapD
MVLVFPGIIQNPNLSRIVGILLVIIPFVAPLLFWACARGQVVIRRARFYPHLYQRVQQALADQENLGRAYYDLISQIRERNSFELSQATWQQGKLYIGLRKSRNKKQTLDVGDVLHVVDRGDEKVMGRFCVTESHETEYYAVSTEVDRLWLGYVRQIGTVTMFPNMEAIHVAQGGTK